MLEHLLGEKHGTSYKNWVEAMGRREDITPAPGYVAFKSRLFAKIDPALAALLREDAPRTIRAEEIVWGGVTERVSRACLRIARSGSAPPRSIRVWSCGLRTTNQQPGMS